MLFWIGGLTMGFLTSIAAGATSVWCERFDADEVLPLIERERITRLAIYPHQVAQLLAHPGFASTDRSTLRIADPRLAPDGTTTTIILTPEGHRMGLGMSETFGPYSWGSGGTKVIAPVQDVQPGLEIRVVDKHNQPVGDGATGEIVLRGRCVTPGYYKRPRDVGFDADGWFHTGGPVAVQGSNRDRDLHVRRDLVDADVQSPTPRARRDDRAARRCHGHLTRRRALTRGGGRPPSRRCR